MFGFSIRTRQNVSGGSPKTTTDSPSTLGTPRSTGSPRTEVGEIDTRAPFQSVKAAVSMFGEGASPKARPVLKKPKTAEERVLERETQLHIALKELDKFKEAMKSAENTKAQAVRDLEKANRALQELTCKLETASESKQAAIAATEAAKSRAKQLEEVKSNKEQLADGGSWKQDVDSEREQYKASAAELIAVKQELTNVRQDFDAALVTKLAAFQEAADAQHATKVNKKRHAGLSKEIATMRETLSQVKVAIAQAEEEQAKSVVDKETCIESLRMAKEEVEKKIMSLKEEESELKLCGTLEEKLEETTEAIAVLEEQLKNVRESDLESIRTVTLELEDAKNALQQVLQEESSLRSSMESLKMELDKVKRDCSGGKEKADESESVAENLRGELERTKLELEAAIAEETKEEEASCDAHLKLQQVSSEADDARREAEEIKRSIEELKKEAETARNVTKEMEENLQTALKEAEEAKAAEKLVSDQIRVTPDATNSNSKDKIKLSAEEYETLSKKVEEFEKAAQVKVAAAMAEVEVSNAKERETVKRLEASLKEMEEIKAATEEALKKAEMAEAAKQVVEGELLRWHQQEQDTVAGESSCSQQDPKGSSHLLD